jgi:hypothetical protein
MCVFEVNPTSLMKPYKSYGLNHTFKDAPVIPNSSYMASTLVDVFFVLQRNTGVSNGAISSVGYIHLLLDMLVPIMYYQIEIHLGLISLIHYFL